MLGISSFELDDWSDGVTILPSTILEVRSTQTLPDIDDTAVAKTKDGQLAKEILERTSKDQAILQKLQESYGSLEMSIIDKKRDTILSPTAVDTATDSNPSTQRFPLKYKRRNSGLITRSNRVNLLDIRRRPKWEITRNHRRKSDSTSRGIQDSEITLYLDRKPPDLSVQRTVGGLNKKLADYCWSIFAAYGDVESKI